MLQWQMSLQIEHLKNEKTLLIKPNLSEPYLQISQGHLIVSVMNYLLQNSTHMDLLYLNYD